MLSTSINAPRISAAEPAAEVLLLAEVEAFLHANSGDEDDLLNSLIIAARVVFEDITARCLVATVVTAYWDMWPRVGTYYGACDSREIELPRAPLISVESVKYLDTDGTLQTVPPADYTVDPCLSADHFGRLRFKSSASLPSLGDFPGALRIAFTAGHGDDAAAVPEPIKAALKLLVSHLFHNRVPVNVGNIVNEVPFTLKALIERYQIRGIA